MKLFLLAGIRLQRQVRAKSLQSHRHGHALRVRQIPSIDEMLPLREAAAPAAVARRRGPLPAPKARRREREGRTSALLVLPSSGSRGAAPQRARRNHSHPFASHHEGSAAGFALRPTRGKPKGAVSPSCSPFAPAALCNGPLPAESASRRYLQQRQRAFTPMVGHSTRATASELCKLSPTSSKAQPSSRHAPSGLSLEAWRL